MYSLRGYGDMLLDRGRTVAYADALRACVEPGSVVADVGCGPGIFSLLACRYGARRVYAIEPNDIIGCARDAALRNGFADRVVFLQGLSTAIALPEKADLIVSDVRGVLPFYGASIASLIDARTRLLAPGGQMVPTRDTLWAALVHAPDRLDKLAAPWSGEYDLHFPAAQACALNEWGRAEINAEELITPPICWSTLDYMTIVSPSVRGSARWTMDRGATAHGLALWFDCTTGGAYGFSNSPLAADRHVYGQGFFPLSAPLELAPGDAVCSEIRADLVGGGYIFGWKTSVSPDSAARPRQVFSQSSFLAQPLGKDGLHKRAHSFVPELNRNAEIDRAILDEMSAGRCLDHIARAMAERFPDYFHSWTHALAHVSELSSRYSL